MHTVFDCGRMFAQWGLPHCAFFDKRKRGENAVNENQEKTTAEVVTLEKTQPASEFVLEMTDIEKQFPGVKALDHAKLRLRPGTEIGRASCRERV